MKKPAPMLGENNHYVLSGVLGLDESQIADMEASDVVGQELTGARTPSAVPLDRQVELGWTVDYDSDYRERQSSPNVD
jgi:hypothetical protein